MRAVADTGPLLTAIRADRPGHRTTAHVVAGLGRDLLVLDVVAAELDYMVRQRVGSHAARAFAQALVKGEHAYGQVTPGLFQRATEIDRQFADLNLGLVDASIMAYAERHDLPILTFDFKHFRATRPASGSWRLVIDESQYARAIA